MDTIYLENTQVPAHLRGNYSGRKFSAIVTDTITISSHDGLWDGGSRTTYSLVNIETGESVPASDNMSAPWDNTRQDRTVTLRPGFAAIRHSIFCGKDMGLTFYVHPDNAAKLLPAPAAELSPYECTVLEATCSKKSHYMGKDRYQMAKDDCVDWNGQPREYGRRDYGIGDLPFPTREQWNAAKDSLISKGLLNKAGAVTVKGRNARA